MKQLHLLADTIQYNTGLMKYKLTVSADKVTLEVICKVTSGSKGTVLRTLFPSQEQQQQNRQQPRAHKQQHKQHKQHHNDCVKPAEKVPESHQAPERTQTSFIPQIFSPRERAANFLTYLSVLILLL